MRYVVRLLMLALAVALATWVLGWIAVPLVAVAWGALAGREDGPVEATIGTLTAWMALLAAAAFAGGAGTVARTLGGVVGIPALVLPAVTLIFGAAMAWSAAVVGRELARAAGRGGRAAALAVAAAGSMAACDRPIGGGVPADTAFVTDTATVERVVAGGEVTLTGRYHPHPGYPDVRATCFSIDEASAHQLPRVATGERRVSLCFENAEEAARSLGPPGTSGDATIVVDRYAAERADTGAVDAARLVRVLSRAPEGSIP